MRYAIFCLLCAFFFRQDTLDAEEWSALVSPSNSFEFKLLKKQTPVAHLTVAGWGPNWQWVGVSSHDKATGSQLDVSTKFVVSRDRGEVIDIRLQVRRTGTRQIQFQYDLTADKDVPVTMLIAGLGPEKEFARGRWDLFHADGSRSEVKLPVGTTSRPPIKRAVLRMTDGGEVEFTLDSPCPIAFDGDMRILLADGLFRAGHTTTKMTVTFSDDADLLVTEEDLQNLSRTVAGPDWFPLDMNIRPGLPSVIAMDGWLDKPAGRRGGVRMVGDQFQLEDGTPIRFWGTNLSYGSGCAPQKDDAEATAARFARYGVNCVRLHKFSYPKNHNGIGDLNDATRMDPDGQDRMDYFASQLAQRGIYYAWSHTFRFQIGAGNRDRLVAYDEIEQYLKGDTYAFINFAEDVQDLMIDMVVNLLKHRNPHTGKSYAEDPALAFIELQNEDDIFFFTSERAFNACPTYRKLFTAKFSEWLAKKYVSEAALAEAWGGLQAGESLAAKNITPQTNPWYFGSDNLPKQKGGPRQRLLDASAWMHELQNQFYSRFVRAIRDAGYQGPICGS
ncbi:MAG: hypothetical protein KDA96_25565, partial [Planctomycetaceae bacterium]|nr:hypothetical protein [Planctomycetaceae bacterium]